MLPAARRAVSKFQTPRADPRGSVECSTRKLPSFASQPSLASIYGRKYSIPPTSSSWERTSLSGTFTRRFFSSSASNLAKRTFRRSIHSDPTEEDYLQDDQEFQRILREQSERVAEYRAQQSVEESSEGPVAGAKQEESKETAKAENTRRRKELIAQMVEKHVPLRDTDKSIEMFNTLIYGFVKAGSIENAQEVFSQMNAHDIPPNKTTFGLLAKGFSQAEPPMIDELQALMNLMAGTVGMDTLAFNCLISSYAAIGRACHPREMFELMRSHDVIEDITTCNILLINYARLKDGRALEFAEDVLLWMKEHKIRPDAITYNAIIDCCRGDISRAMDFYNASQAAAKAGDISATPDENRLSAMLRNFTAAKQLDQAQDFLHEFLTTYPDYQLTSGNQANLFALNTACLRIREAFDDIDAYLDTIRPNIPVDICKPILNALEGLPEAVLTENAQLLEEWKTKIKRYPTTNLSQSDAEHWRICLLRWRSIYIPDASRSQPL